MLMEEYFEDILMLMEEYWSLPQDPVDAYLRLHNQPTSPELLFYILSQSSLKDFFQHCRFHFWVWALLTEQAWTQLFFLNGIAMAFPDFRFQIQHIIPIVPDCELYFWSNQKVGRKAYWQVRCGKKPCSTFPIHLFPPFSTKVLFPLLNCWSQD